MSTLDRTDAGVSGWAVGLAAFAGAIMLLIGIFQAFAGLAAIFEDQFFVVGAELHVRHRRDDLGLDPPDPRGDHRVRRHLDLLGRGAGPGRRQCVLAILSAVANFFFIPYYPVWSVLIIALCIAVIWALVQDGPEEARR